MALKGDRLVIETNISYTCNDVVSKGQILVYSTTLLGSGTAMADDKAGVAALAANPSGKVPLGLTLANFVNIDQTRQHRNFHRDEQIIGEKAPLLRQGWVGTNMVIGSVTAPGPAYLTTSGNVTPTISATGGLVATPKVGEFQSIADEDGYVRLALNLPY